MYTLRGKQRRLRARFGKVVEQQANMRGHHLEGTAAGARGIGVDGEGVWLRLREEQQCPRDDDEGNHHFKRHYLLTSCMLVVIAIGSSTRKTGTT